MLTSAGPQLFPLGMKHITPERLQRLSVKCEVPTKAARKDQPMMDMSKEHLNGERDSLFTDFPDETLENAAHTTSKSANYTLGACTGLSVCPA